MPTKRLRIISGPNGSGKSTWLEKIKDNVPLGVYVNADDIERTIKQTGQLSLQAYKIKTTNKLMLVVFYIMCCYSFPINSILFPICCIVSTTNIMRVIMSITILYPSVTIRQWC